MKRNFVTSLGGTSYWTKRRQIRNNTKQRMKEVKECLQTSNEITESEDENVTQKVPVLQTTQDDAQLTGSDTDDDAERLQESSVLLDSESHHFLDSNLTNISVDCEDIEFLHRSSDDEQEVLHKTDTGNIDLPGTNDLKEQLAEWAVKFNISQVSLKNLLEILKPYCKDLPRDPRSLLSTPREYTIKSIGNGSYYHFGIKEHIVKAIQGGYTAQNSEVFISINIDGLPLYKSSKTQVWPILGMINDATTLSNFDPFTIGVFCGVSKPDNIDAFLEDFVGEMKLLYQNGVQVDEKTFVVKIKCFVCDAPARAYLKQTKGHNAYHGCERCTQHGVWLNKVTFPDCSASLRTDKEFATKQDPNHHGPTNSPLQDLPVGLVSQFVLDPMHLIYLGVLRRLLWLWLKSPVSNRCRIGSIQIRAISECLVNFQGFIPREFARKCRSLYDMERWKATELRQFLLYSGIVALKKRLPPDFYEHFLLLFVAVFSLSSPDLYMQFCDYANQLLNGFVRHFSSLYGSNMLVYNVHNLIHVATDVRRYGPLDTFSAFKFESFLGRLKKLIRKPNQPLSQIVRRIAESEANVAVFNGRQEQHKIEPKKEHSMGPLPFMQFAHCQYTTVENNGLFYSITKPDNCVKIGKKIYLIRNIICQKDKEVKLVCENYTKTGSFFTYPLCSTEIGIYEVSHLSGHTEVYPITDIKCKYVRLPYLQNFVVIPMLNHCL